MPVTKHGIFCFEVEQKTVNLCLKVFHPFTEMTHSQDPSWPDKTSILHDASFTTAEEGSG